MESVKVRFMRQYMHPWMLSYYIDKFSTLMARIELCMKISQALAEGADPQKLHFLQRSRNLWEGIEEPAFAQTLPLLEKPGVPYPEIQRWIPLASPMDNIQEDFFKHFNRVKRPEIWVMEPSPKLLFDIYSERFLNVRSATFESPGEMTVDVGSGLAEVIHELRYGHRRELRERERHEEEMKQKKLETKLLEQEVISKIIDNIKKMKEIGLIESVHANLAEVVEIAIDTLEILNERTGATLEFAEPVRRADARRA